MSRYEKGKLQVHIIQIERGAQTPGYTSKTVPDLMAATIVHNEVYKCLMGMPMALDLLEPQTSTVATAIAAMDDTPWLTCGARRYWSS